MTVLILKFFCLFSWFFSCFLDFFPFFCVCVLCCCCCLFAVVFAICLGFCLFVFFSLFFFLSFFSGCTVQLAGSWFPSQGSGWASGVGAPRPGHWTSREFPGPGNINCHARSQRYPYQHQDLAPHNCLQAPVLDTSHPITIKTETQPHPSADRLHKLELSSQTPKTQHLTCSCPRGKRFSSTHQSTGTSPSHQEAYTRPCINLTHQGEDNRSKRNYDPAACRKETINTVG